MLKISQVDDEREVFIKNKRERLLATYPQLTEDEYNELGKQDIGDAPFYLLAQIKDLKIVIDKQTETITRLVDALEKGMKIVK